MLEFELKATLTASEYIFLKTKRFHMGRVVLQRNYYYDTDNYELNDHGITCRIREKNGDCVATIKDHQPFGCSIETSQPAKNPFDTTFFRGMGLSFQGELTTIRTTCVTHDCFFAALDENRYLGTVDYELEYEFDPKKRMKLNQEIFKLAQDLEYHNVIKDSREFYQRFTDGISKSKRFFLRKKELGDSNNKKF